MGHRYLPASFDLGGPVDTYRNSTSAPKELGGGRRLAASVGSPFRRSTPVSADPSILAFLVLRQDRADRPCAGHGDLFFPPDGRELWSDKTERERQALALCARCSVATECLDEAMVRGERWGIWGGLTARQRQLLGRPAASAHRTTDRGTKS